MQHNTISIKQWLLKGVVGLLWVAGLLIAGSDSDYMPWMNIIGVIVFLGASLFLGTRLHEKKEDTGTIIQAKFTKKQAYHNRRCHSRYALSA